MQQSIHSLLHKPKVTEQMQLGAVVSEKNERQRVPSLNQTQKVLQNGERPEKYHATFHRGLGEFDEPTALLELIYGLVIDIPGRLAECLRGEPGSQMSELVA